MEFRRHRWTVLAALLLSILACGPLSAVGNGGAADNEPVDCTGAALAAADAVPGEQIMITGFPASAGVEDYTVLWAADGVEVEGALVLLEDGTTYTVAPAHPAGIEGGEIDFVLSSDDTTCTEETVSIAALDPAPEAIDELVELTGEYLALSREQAGVTRETLLNDDLSDADPATITLAVMQEMYDGPDNENALVRVADGSAAILEEEPLDRDLVNAMIAHYGVTDWMEEQLEMLHTQQASTGTYARPAAQSTYFPPTLSQAMSRQQDCETSVSSDTATGKVRADFELGAIGIGLVNAPAGLLVGGGLLLWRLQAEQCAYTLPGEFSRIEMDVSETEFEEDWDQGPGEVTSVRVWASSAGWELSGTLFDAALLAAGAAGHLAKAGKAADFLGALDGVLNNVCGRISSCANQEMVNVPPETWGPISGFANTEWSEFEVRPAPQNAFEQSGDFGYLPREVGQSRVEVRIIASKFGGDSISAHEDVQVEEIDVNLQPNSANLEPGDSVTFNVTINNAIHSELNEWTLITPEGNQSIVATNATSFTFAAPDFETEECQTVTKRWGLSVEATSNTGPRATSSEPRVDQAGISVTKEPDEEDCPTPTPTPRPDECVIGTWAVDLESFRSAIASMGGGSVTSIDGAYLVTFTEESMLTTDADFVLTVEAEGRTLSIPIQQQGTVTYRANESTGEMFVGAGTQGTATIFNVTGQSTADAASAQYECSGNTMSVNSAGAAQPIILIRQ